MRLGLDIGGTKIDAVALDADDAVLARVRIPTGFGPAAVLGNAQSAAIQAADAAGVGPASFASLGIGIPGLVDATGGLVRHAVNLGVDELDLGPELASRLGLPVFVENDVNAASLGAYHLLGLDTSAAYLNLGTGLAAGFVLGGELWRGARGTAGEIGHIPVDPAGEICACGQRGCLETVASGGWLARKWGSAAPFPVLDVFDRADDGDARAIALRDELVGGAAAAVRILVLTVDVDVVVIGGGLSNLGARLLDRVATALDDQARDSQFLASLELSSRVRLVPLDQPIAAIGAALAGRPAGESIRI
ncbi:ROK family protein [Gryllotalpicola reticulitermitis]|uniref:ROK family protein n=1 Tax=Gryllotalpicola reticulitermitis TaxID=1184153 RepID=A0ABV8Q3U5_9MICO